MAVDTPLPRTRPSGDDTVSSPTELRSRAAGLEQRVPPILAGPRTDDERMWLEKAAGLRAEADQIEARASRVAEK